MKHPNWYYKHFNDVFSAKKEYDFEIDQITTISPLESKRVQEIGAGTGEHARRILKKNIEYLELVDYDANSVEILERRFGSNPLVRIRFGDGFRDGIWNCFDLVISMYSAILLNIADEQALSSRIDILLERIAKKGILIFEIVDRDVTLAVRKEGHTTILKENDKQKISVQTSYSQNQVHLTYAGHLDNRNVYYRASLLSINKNKILSLLNKKNKISDIGAVNLDKCGRRVLVFAKK